jgi:hypothetical protein
MQCYSGYNGAHSRVGTAELKEHHRHRRHADLTNHKTVLSDLISKRSLDETVIDVSVSDDDVISRDADLVRRKQKTGEYILGQFSPINHVSSVVYSLRGVHGFAES